MVKTNRISFKGDNMTRKIMVGIALLIWNFSTLGLTAETWEGLGYLEMGKGKKVLVMVPGIGDLKENYLDLAKLLSSDAKIYLLDLRGLGESGTQFSSYGADETADDLERFLIHKDIKDPIIIANSMSCASAIRVAMSEKIRVQHLVLTGPFVEDTNMGFWMKLGIRSLFFGPWGPASFRSFYESLYPGKKPEDLNLHSQRIYENLKEDGRLHAVRSMFLASKPQSAKALLEMNTTNTIVMGDKDPDFEDPIVEAKRISQLTKGSYEIFEGSGHYPYKDNPLGLAKLIKKIWLKK